MAAGASVNLDLSKLTVSQTGISASQYGLPGALIVVVDPLNRTNDIDRSNNVAVLLVNFTSTGSDIEFSVAENDWDLTNACKVMSSIEDGGSSALLVSFRSMPYLFDGKTFAFSKAEKKEVTALIKGSFQSDQIATRLKAMQRCNEQAFAATGDDPKAAARDSLLSNVLQLIRDMRRDLTALVVRAHGSAARLQHNNSMAFLAAAEEVLKTALEGDPKSRAFVMQILSFKMKSYLLDRKHGGHKGPKEGMGGAFGEMGGPHGGIGEMFVGMGGSQDGMSGMFGGMGGPKGRMGDMSGGMGGSQGGMSGMFGRMGGPQGGMGGMFGGKGGPQGEMSTSGVRRGPEGSGGNMRPTDGTVSSQPPNFDNSRPPQNILPFESGALRTSLSPMTANSVTNNSGNNAVFSASSNGVQSWGEQSDGSFICKDGTRIDMIKIKCDGFTDCRDKSDEASCTRRFKRDASIEDMNSMEDHNSTEDLNSVEETNSTENDNDDWAIGNSIDDFASDEDISHALTRLIGSAGDDKETAAAQDEFLTLLQDIMRKNVASKPGFNNNIENSVQQNERR
ncbi:keratin, type II cytoskeletal 2 epidermal [Hyalella azteca]|uniref:Keratin, type II cytoskeletal 2 epidermal n=1 Tax=Hyalella azteca TaxID=294128 RepID=A0A8B7NQU9_HYAAZ|nr:keratin, type II cytoskeletal 2 epidermal [Hyalella azteca]